MPRTMPAHAAIKMQKGMASQNVRWPSPNGPSEVRTAIDFAGDNVILASNADGTQLYIIGGNQNIDGLLDKTDDGSKDFLDLGPLAKIIYRARKDFDRFEEIDYVHRMGDGGHAKPRVFYDRLDHQLYIAGGEYKVKRGGIVN